MWVGKRLDKKMGWENNAVDRFFANLFIYK